MLENLDWKYILTNIQGFASSDTVKDAILETHPCTSQEQALQQMHEIEEAQNILSSGLRPFLQSVDLFPVWYDRLHRKAVLKPLEFRDVRAFCVEIIALESALKEFPQLQWGKKILSLLIDAKEPLSAIEQILSPEGDIRSDASERLYSLFKEKQDKEREIRTSLDKLVKAHEMEPLLQDKYVTNREGRWVLPIRSGMRHNIDGIIHDVSHTKQTVFMEPQAVVQINNLLRQIEVNINEEIERLLKELSRYLSDHCPDFLRSKNALIEADMRFAQGQFSQMIRAAVPEFTDKVIRLKDLRHPLLALNVGVDKIIPNTVTLEENSGILILSGPNAGGKTVLLKSIGLAAQMARCGLPICAKAGSQIPFFKTVLTAVGDAQSVEQHLSTFASHLKSLTQALELKGNENLILVDEICGSTDPEEGSALARSFIEGYAKNGVFGIITSHLGPLKSGWDTQTRVLTGSMDFDDKSSQPTYQLIMGLYGRSLAIKTAKKVGVPDSVVDRALELMGPEAKEREDRLTELEHQRNELHTLRKEFQKMANEAKDVKLRYSQLVDKFKHQKEDWMKRAVEQAEKKIEMIYDEVRRESKTKSLGDFKAMLPQIIKSASRPVIETAEDFAKAYPPGNSVFVKTLNQDAVVQGTPNAKGEIPVLSNSMRLFVHWTELGSPKSANNPTAALARKSGIVTVSLHDEDRLIDLRGQRVEDALEKLETELDTAVRNKEERVKIIHGHGTEALKKAVRAYFARSVYVKKWKAGDPHSGGDGITWVELTD